MKTFVLPSCDRCGSGGDLKPYVIGGEEFFLCKVCFDEVKMIDKGGL